MLEKMTFRNQVLIWSLLILGFLATSASGEQPSAQKYRLLHYASSSSHQPNRVGHACKNWGAQPDVEFHAPWMAEEWAEKGGWKPPAPLCQILGNWQASGWGTEQARSPHFDCGWCEMKIKEDLSRVEIADGKGYTLTVRLTSPQCVLESDTRRATVAWKIDFLHAGENVPCIRN